MATERLSPGVYRVNGVTVRARNASQAEQIAGKKSGSGKGKSGSGKKAGGKVKPALNAKAQARANADIEQGRQFAGANALTQNANVVTPFSNTTTTVDPATGQATQTTSMSDVEQGKYNAGSQLNQQGLDAANAQFSQVYGQPFEMEGGQDARDRAYDTAYAYLTKNVDRDYAREKAQMEQDLYNRGIPIDPSNPQYQKWMGSLDEKYQGIKDNAANMAYGQSLNEFSTQYDVQSGIHNTQTGDLAQMSNMGTGFMVPNAPQFQGSSIENPGATATDLAYKQLQQGNRQLNIQQQAASRRNQPQAQAPAEEDYGFDG